MIPFSPEREEHLAVGVMSVAGLSQAISESWKHNTGNQIARMYNARINLLCLIWHKRVNYKLLCNITPPPPQLPPLSFGRVAVGGPCQCLPSACITTD